MLDARYTARENESGAASGVAVASTNRKGQVYRYKEDSRNEKRYKSFTNDESTHLVKGGKIKGLEKIIATNVAKQLPLLQL